MVDERVFTTFVLDTKNGLERVKIMTSFEDRGAARDKLENQINKTMNGDSSMMAVRDNRTGDFRFVNLMKLASINLSLEEMPES